MQRKRQGCISVVIAIDNQENVYRNALMVLCIAIYVVVCVLCIATVSVNLAIT